MEESTKVDPRILEKRAKNTEYMRQKRAKMSEEDRKKENEKQRQRRAQRSHEEHQKVCENRRLERTLRRALMSEEELQKESEKRRLKRRQITPEQRQKDYERRLRKSGLSAEEYRVKENERKRLYLEGRKTPHESEEAKEKEFLKRQARREQKRKQIQDWKLNDPVKYREYLDKQRFSNAIRKAIMTEEEKEEQRRKTYLYKQARKATFTLEEIEERKRKSVAASIKSQKKRWEEATEEEKEQRKVYFRITQQKMKLRKNLFMEGLSTEKVKKMADEQEAIWWKEVYPEGKPSRCRKTPQSKPIWTPDVVNNGIKACEVEVFKYICVKCHPKWKMGPGKWQVVGFNSKLDILHHVMQKHPFSYFPCSSCNLLKYSKKALDTHLTYCSNKDTSLS